MAVHMQLLTTQDNLDDNWLYIHVCALLDCWMPPQQGQNDYYSLRERESEHTYRFIDEKSAINHTLQCMLWCFCTTWLHSNIHLSLPLIFSEILWIWIPEYNMVCLVVRSCIYEYLFLTIYRKTMSMQALQSDSNLTQEMYIWNPKQAKRWKHLRRFKNLEVTYLDKLWIAHSIFTLATSLLLLQSLLTVNIPHSQQHN
jgi:hypothetical protein